MSLTSQEIQRCLGCIFMAIPQYISNLLGYLMYYLRKQPPFYPLKNQVKSPGAALIRMTACCYKVKFCYFPRDPWQGVLGKFHLVSQFPSLSIPREFSKRKLDPEILLPTIFSLPFPCSLAETPGRKWKLKHWPNGHFFFM